jgi:hypothetical protein
MLFYFFNSYGKNIIIIIFKKYKMVSKTCLKQYVKVIMPSLDLTERHSLQIIFQ